MNYLNGYSDSSSSSSSSMAYSTSTSPGAQSTSMSPSSEDSTPRRMQEHATTMDKASAKCLLNNGAQLDRSCNRHRARVGLAISKLDLSSRKTFAGQIGDVRADRARVQLSSKEPSLGDLPYLVLQNSAGSHSVPIPANAVQWLNTEIENAVDVAQDTRQSTEKVRQFGHDHIRMRFFPNHRNPLHIRSNFDDQAALSFQFADIGTLGSLLSRETVSKQDELTLELVQKNTPRISSENIRNGLMRADVAAGRLW